MTPAHGLRVAGKNHEMAILVGCSQQVNNHSATRINTADIQMNREVDGSSVLIHTLAENDLVDEYSLHV